VIVEACAVLSVYALIKGLGGGVPQGRNFVEKFVHQIISTKYKGVEYVEREKIGYSDGPRGTTWHYGRIIRTYPAVSASEFVVRYDGAVISYEKDDNCTIINIATDGKTHSFRFTRGTNDVERFLGWLNCLPGNKLRSRTL
jgi:hypothetical protein